MLATGEPDQHSWASKMAVHHHLVFLALSSVVRSTASGMSLVLMYSAMYGYQRHTVRNPTASAVK